MRRAVSAVVLLGIVAVVTVAVLDAVREGSPASESVTPTRPDRLRGPDVPQPSVLPGRLLVATQPGCRLQVIDLRTLEPGPVGPPSACRTWAAPAGDYAVVARRDAQTGAARDLWLVRVEGDEPAIERRLGLARSRPSWSADGALVAWCGDDGRTVVESVDGGIVERLAGCFPSVQLDGSVATRSAERAIFVDGAFLTDPEPNPGERLVGQGAGSSGLALAVQSPLEGLEAETVLQLWRGGEPRRSLVLPLLYGPAAGFFGMRIEISPTGSEAAFIAPETLVAGRADDLAALVDLDSGRLSEEIEGRAFAGLAWSPDGTWLALATGESVLVFGTPRVEPVYALPIAAGGVAWLSG